MIRSVILSLVFFCIMLTIPYALDAGVVLDPKHEEVKNTDWIDPNTESQIGDYFISKDGLLCANRIWQVYVNGVSNPARKCQLPDGSWQTFFY
jgi:hypothetical protein